MTAEEYFALGKSYDLKQDSSLAAGSLARAAFQNGHEMGHTGCTRALAGLSFYGVAGGKDEWLAFRLLWGAFLKGDRDSLTELGEMLEESAEEKSAVEVSKDFGLAATRCHEIKANIEGLREFFGAYGNQSDSKRDLPKS